MKEITYTIDVPLFTFITVSTQTNEMTHLMLYRLYFQSHVCLVLLYMTSWTHPTIHDAQNPTMHDCLDILYKMRDPPIHDPLVGPYYT